MSSASADGRRATSDQHELVSRELDWRAAPPELIASLRREIEANTLTWDGAHRALRLLRKFPFRKEGAPAEVAIATPARRKVLRQLVDERAGNPELRKSLRPTIESGTVTSDMAQLAFDRFSELPVHDRHAPGWGQLAQLSRLLDDRAVPEEVAKSIRYAMKANTLARSQAQNAIDRFRDLPVQGHQRAWTNERSLDELVFSVADECQSLADEIEELADQIEKQAAPGPVAPSPAQLHGDVRELVRRLNTSLAAPDKDAPRASSVRTGHIRLLLSRHQAPDDLYEALWATLEARTLTNADADSASRCLKAFPVREAVATRRDQELRDDAQRRLDDIQRRRDRIQRASDRIRQAVPEGMWGEFLHEVRWYLGIHTESHRHRLSARQVLVEIIFEGMAGPLIGSGEDLDLAKKSRSWCVVFDSPEA